MFAQGSSLRQQTKLRLHQHQARHASACFGVRGRASGHPSRFVVVPRAATAEVEAPAATKVEGSKRYRQARDLFASKVSSEKKKKKKKKKERKNFGF